MNLSLRIFPLLCAASGFCAGQPFPEAEWEVHPVERYRKIWELSPFVAVTDLSGQMDDTEGRFVLTGYFKVDDRDVILLFDRTTLERFAIARGESRNGVSLESVESGADILSLRASIATGGKTVQLSYDPESVPANVAHTGAPQGMPQQHGVPGPPMPPGANSISGGSQQMQNQPPPVRRVIRRRAIVAPE